jgi:small subunit ribosomal protein S16
MLFVDWKSIKKRRTACKGDLPRPQQAKQFISTQGTVMVVIRLSRGGAKKRPFFNIVVADSRTRRDGRFIERVGFYNPVASGGEQPLRVAFDRVEHWTSTGAQMSPTVARLVAQAKTAA